MKYEVGMKVVVRPDITVTSFSYSITHEMLEYRGRVAKITHVREFDRPCYNLDIDDRQYNWDEEWITVLALNKGKHEEEQDGAIF